VSRLEYFGIAVSSTVITSTLSSLFSHTSPEESKIYNMLKHSRRLQSEFHVTLIHRASGSQHPDIWESYVDKYRTSVSSNKSTKENDQLTPSLGPARLRLERVVWDDRLMAFVVRILPSDTDTGGAMVWECANAIPHITVGTANKDIKPKESNDLLARWADGEGNGRIWEKEVPSVKVLEGTVRAVLQRGR